MRKFLSVVLISLIAMGAHAWEPTTADAHTEDASAQPSYAEALVTIAPVPMPDMVIELARYSSKSPSVGQAKKVKAAQVVRAKTMLSRSAREQMNLASTRAKQDDRVVLNVSDDEDADTGFDELDLHRSFSQPKVAKVFDQTDDDDKDLTNLPDHVKLRLLIARSKAVDAHILSQVGKAPLAADEELSDMVKVRLHLARARAVKAHIEKFGAA